MLVSLVLALYTAALTFAKIVITKEQINVGALAFYRFIFVYGIELGKKLFARKFEN